MRLAAARRPLVIPAGLAFITLACLFLAQVSWYRNYRLYGDDLSVLSASAGPPRNWFVHGFSDYFRVYPEWSPAITDFLRPATNAIIRGEELLFGSHYILYFLILYLAQFLMIWLLLLLARDLGVGNRWLAVLALLLSIEPAFVGRDLRNIGFHEDVWSGLFVITAFFLIGRKRYVTTSFVLVFALFTKEVAIFAPIAAALTVLFQTKRKPWALAMLAPLAIYFAVRQFFFVHSGASGSYVLPGTTFKSLGLYLLRGVLFWPIGNFANGAGIALDIAGSIAFWILIALSVRRLYVTRDERSLSAFAVLIWLLGSLAVGVTLAQQTRLGGSTFPLELLLLAALVTTSTSRSLRVLSCSVLALIAFSYCSNLLAFPRSFPDQRYQQQSVQRLLSDLNSDGQEAKVIYILNSTEDSTGPEYLGRMAHVPGRVVVLNQFDGCLSSNEGTTSFHDFDTSSVAISVRIPPCAQLVFSSLEKSDFDPQPKVVVDRGELAKYSFADAQPAWRHPWDTRYHTLNLGRDMTVTLRFDPKDSILLYYDWQASKYRCRGTSCTSR